MKKIFLSLIVVLMSTFANAQLFSYDRVLIYVKAGIEPSKAREGQVKVIGYFADRDEIRNMSSSAERIRKTLSSHPSYLKSPYNLPDKICTLFQGYTAPKWCTINYSATTSKYRVYSGQAYSGSERVTKNWAFSKNGEQLIFWISGNEDNRTTYLLTKPSEFEPSTSSSSNYDFLE